MNDENGSPRGQPGYGDRGTQSQSQSQSQGHSQSQSQSPAQSQPQRSTTGSPPEEGDQERRTPETEPTIADYGGQGPAGDEKDKDGKDRPRDYENPPRDQQGLQPGADLAKAQEQGPLDK